MNICNTKKLIFPGFCQIIPGWLVSMLACSNNSKSAASISEYIRDRNSLQSNRNSVDVNCEGTVQYFSILPNGTNSRFW